MDNLISEEEFRALRAQLEAKQEEYLHALKVMAASPKKYPIAEDALFKLLGVVTFWLSLPCPTVAQATGVRQALVTFHVEVRTRNAGENS